ncbi:MAG: right-handed parallel beta-helix repeat-containing protein [Myxococcaceae bacterium]
MALILSGAALGEELHVATTGDDQRGDGSKQRPFATLSRAASAARPGTVVEVHGGRYRMANEQVACRGTADRPIVIRPHRGEKVLFDGSGAVLSAWESVVLIQRSSHLVFQGFEIAHSPARGLSVYESDHVTVRDCFIHDTWRGALSAAGSDLTFERNEISDAVKINEGERLGGRGGWPAAAGTYSGEDGAPATRIVFEDNHLHDSWGECLDLLRADGVRVEGNRIHDCYSVNLYLDTARNVLVRGNRIYATSDRYNRASSGGRAMGILLATEGGSGFPRATALEHIVLTGNEVWGVGVGIGYWHDRSNATRTNTYSDVAVTRNVLRDVRGRSIDWERVDPSHPPPSGAVLEGNVLRSGPGETSFRLGNPGAWRVLGNVSPAGGAGAD